MTATHNPPHLSASNIGAATKRGLFWIPGDKTPTPFGTAMRGPLFVEWESPEEVTQPFPLILIHGGGGQGTDWLATPDGRPGWASEFVKAGFAVYVIDRPGHGRSPHHPDVLGPAAPPFPFEAAQAYFAPTGPQAVGHTQWPWGRELEDPEMAQVYSGMGFFMTDLAESQELDGARLASLLDLTGPAVLVSHSAGAPGGWMAANKRPDLVRAIVSVEPMGPPFAEFPGLGPISYGLTYAALRTEPPLDSPTELQENPSAYQVPGLTGTPIQIVTGGASPTAPGGPDTVKFLAALGADAELMHLPDHGIEGNGHGLIFEMNSSETAQLVINWIQALDARPA
ncbi:alpha/beta fold hydrolase [Arthrobacter sp. Z1-9]